ncbi:MAG TPA: ABC transporter permease [Firmicutes bacterium]|nr:ABC transporter permease [Bacillota bacterium]
MRIRSGYSIKSILGARETVLLLVSITFSIILSFLSPRFLSVNNLVSIATGMTYDVIMATGMTLVLIVGGIDLSVGSILGLTGVVTTMMLRSGVSIAVSVTAGLMLGVLLGAINGTMISNFKINPFIVTLGMMAIARGAAVVLTSGYFLSNLPPSYLILGQGKLLGIPFPIYVMLLLVILFEYLLKNWSPLYTIFYIGTNPDAAELSGIKVGRMILACYVISGFLSALAGVFMTSRLAMGYAQFGLGAELRAIAASVIGGASMSGGEGSIGGTFLGVLLLAIINNGFVLLNFSVYWQGVVNGLILVLAVAVDAFRRARRGERRI